ncbi:MAG: TonB-dependent receptor [Kangiella sp.]|nr:TonB-dependent receptor [Kangiella sp.]
MDRKFIITALLYAVVGMLIGIHMAATHNHLQHVTHAHILLVGFVVSFIYALCHKLWINADGTMLAKLQFWVHQVGVLAMVIGLYLLYSHKFDASKIEPVLAVSSILVLIGLILMLVMVLKNKSTN